MIYSKNSAGYSNNDKIYIIYLILNIMNADNQKLKKLKWKT